MNDTGDKEGGAYKKDTMDIKVILSDVENILNSSLSHSKILLIEDSKTNMMLLEQILRSAGFNNLEMAVDGEQGLEKFQSFDPDMVVLDIVMPQMDGFEFCRTIRRDKRYEHCKNIPILVQTALSDKEEKSKIFKVGATDYVVKPYDEEELVARVRIHLERQRLFNDLKRSRERVAEELEQAQKMQAVLMPTVERIETLEELFGVNIAPYARASSEMGGDFWSVEEISENEFAIYIVDFSGHGVTAALNTFRLHTLMQIYSGKKLEPGEYLTVLNRELQRLLPVEQFATIFYGVVNTQGNILSYAAAAAPNPIIFRADGDEYEFVDASGVPLGVKEGHVYETQQVSFGPGDLILLYSDALIETENSQGAFFAEEDVLKLVKQSVAAKGNLAKHTRDALIGAFTKDCMANIRDDLTVSVFYRQG